MTLSIIPIEECRGVSGLDVSGSEARGLVRSGRLAAQRIVDIGRWEFVLRCQKFSQFLCDLLVPGRSVYLSRLII